MKVTAKENAKPTIAYPCLGIFPSGNIVLFTDDTTGTVVRQSQEGYNVGHWTECWNREWVLYNGSITLSNED